MNARPHMTSAPSMKAKPSLLATLNAHIHQASQTAHDHAAPHPLSAPNHSMPTPWPDLRSTQRFREIWTLIQVETHIAQATQQAPSHAGPLHAHSLIVRTLNLMHERSPDYLKRFLLEAQTLLWLDATDHEGHKHTTLDMAANTAINPDAHKKPRANGHKKRDRSTRTQS